jgi:oligopeptidase B
VVLGYRPYPHIPRRVHRLVLGGFASARTHVVEDEYYWLRDDARTNPEVVSVLKSENNFTDHFLSVSGCDLLKTQIFEELFGDRWRDAVDDSCALPHERKSLKNSKFFYFTRRELGRALPVVCCKIPPLVLPATHAGTTQGRRGSSLYPGAAAVPQSAREPVMKLLDFSEAGPARRDGVQETDFSSFTVNDAETMMAYGVGAKGSERYRLVVKRMPKMMPGAGGRFKGGSSVVPHDIPALQFCQYFWHGPAVIYYLAADERHRLFQLRRYDFFKKDDVLIYEEKEPNFDLSARSGDTVSDANFVYLTSSSPETTKVWYFEDTGSPTPLVLFAEPRSGLRYEIKYLEPYFYILATEKDQDLSRLLRARPQETDQPQNWQRLDVLGTDNDGWSVANFFLTAARLILLLNKDGRARICVLPVPEGLSAVGARISPLDYSYEAGNLGILHCHFGGKELFFEETDLVTPARVYLLDLHSCAAAKLVHQTKVPGYCTDDFATQRLECAEKDEDSPPVPLTLVYMKKHFRQDGTNPCYLTAYGAYGYTLDTDFRKSILPLLERGVILAMAHVRGSSYCGNSWHEHGKMLEKKNTFRDIITCTRYLHREKYTSPAKTALVGASAGGLAVLATMIRRPDLYGAVVAKVAFSDVLSTLADKDLPLTSREWEEFGNPHEEVFYKYISSYCPYTTVRERKSHEYPPVYMTCAYQDPRVGYWEPLKFITRLRQNQLLSRNVSVLRVKFDSGHIQGPNERTNAAETAEEYAFILKMLHVS